MKKLTNNQKALIGSIGIIFAWIFGIVFENLIPQLIEWLLFLFLNILGGYLIWPMAKDIDKFNDIHNKR